MTRDPVLVGIRLREAREARLLSAPQLAAVSGVSAYTIYGLELGKNMPSLHTAVALCEALGITPNDLVKEEKT